MITALIITNIFFIWTTYEIRKTAVRFKDNWYAAETAFQKSCEEDFKTYKENQRQS